MPLGHFRCPSVAKCGAVWCSVVKCGEVWCGDANTIGVERQCGAVVSMQHWRRIVEEGRRLRRAAAMVQIQRWQQPTTRDQPNAAC